MIKIAITKGRIEKQVCKLLQEANYDMEPVFNKDRELLIKTKDGIEMIFGTRDCSNKALDSLYNKSKITLEAIFFPASVIVLAGPSMY